MLLICSKEASHQNANCLKNKLDMLSQITAQQTCIAKQIYQIVVINAEYEKACNEKIRSLLPNISFDKLVQTIKQLETNLDILQYQHQTLSNEKRRDSQKQSILEKHIKRQDIILQSLLYVLNIYKTNIGNFIADVAQQNAIHKAIEFAKIHIKLQESLFIMQSIYNKLAVFAFSFHKDGQIDNLKQNLEFSRINLSILRNQEIIRNLLLI